MNASNSASFAPETAVICVVFDTLDYRTVVMGVNASNSTLGNRSGILSHSSDHHSPCLIKLHFPMQNVAKKHARSWVQMVMK
jgi:hypothetical protein